MADPTTNEIKAEAADMTTEQKVKATTDIIKALGPLAKEAGPVAGSAIQAMGSTLQAMGPMFLVPALTTLLALPLPPEVKNSIKGIIQQAKLGAPGPNPKTPPAPPTEAQRAAKGVPTWAYVAGGVGVLGLLGYIFTRRKKR
jgi:LPXTG-motif cell wall-anchored protein